MDYERYKLLRFVANRFACLALSTLLPLPALAASTAPLEACTKITDNGARLTCLDREVAALLAREHAATAAAAAVPVSPAVSGAAAPAPGPQLTEEQKMGLTPGRIQQIERPASAPPPLQTLTVPISAISVDGNGHQVITLENGQVWRQVELDTRFSVHVGDSITVSRGASGSYFMSLGKHINTRVSRIR
jgi:hypothetical protein